MDHKTPAEELLAQFSVRIVDEEQEENRKLKSAFVLFRGGQMKQITFTVKCEILDYFAFGPFSTQISLKLSFIFVTFQVMRRTVPGHGALVASVKSRLRYSLPQPPWPFGGITFHADRSDEHRYLVFRVLRIIFRVTLLPDNCESSDQRVN